MSCQSSVSINDVNGKNFGMSATDDGKLVATSTGLLNMPDLFIQDVVGVKWKMFLNANGQLVSTRIGFASAPTFIHIASSGNVQFHLVITTLGRIQLITESSPIPVEIGELLPPDDCLPIFSQPGGPGTPTFPQQDVGQINGLFISPCGHSFNHYMVVFRSISCGPSALLLCPLCSYVIRLFSPASLIYDNQANFILLG
jgi:hypothetical protein